MAKDESQLTGNGKIGKAAKNKLKTAAGGPMLALEPRILLDAAIGDAVAKVADGVAHHVDPAAHNNSQSASKDILLALAPQAREQVGGNQTGRDQTGRDQSGREMLGREQARREVIFVDAGAKNIKELLGKATPLRQVVVLNPNRDGVQQISRALSHMKNIDAIHIFSHGEGGKIQLGKGELSLANIQKYQQQLKQWAAHMSQSADILIYGCNVAEGQRGADFVRMLAQLTQADVAASTDLTGAENLGGDWDLEDTVGHIETNLALSVHGREQYKETLAVSHATLESTGHHLIFDGNNDKVTLAGAGAMFANDASMTIEAWIKMSGDTASGNSYQGIVSNHNASTTGVNDLMVYKDANSNYQLTFMTRSGGVFKILGSKLSTAAGDSTNNLNDGAWHHVAVSYAVAGSSRVASLYVDGAQVSAYQTIVASGTTLSGQNMPAGLHTSNGFIGGRDNTTQGFNGAIDEVRMWNVAKTSTYFSTASNTNGELTGTANSNLVGYWQMNDGIGTVATDSVSTFNSAATANDGNLANFGSDGSTSGWSNSATTIGGTAIAQAVNDNATTNPFSTVSFADAQGDNFALTITLDSAAKGAFSQASLTASGFTDNGGGVYSHASTSAALAQSAIQSLVFQPTQNHLAVGATETTTFTITTDDGKINGTSTDVTTTVIATSINDAPTLSGTAIPAAISDVQTSTVFSDVAIADVDVNTSVSVTISQTLSNGAADTAFANGTFTTLGIGGYNFVQHAGTGTYTLSGVTQAQAQASLQAMVFTPTAKQAAPGATVATTFKLDISDGIASAGQDATTVLTVTNPNAPVSASTNASTNAPATPSGDNVTGISSSALDLAAGGIFDVHGIATTASTNNTSNTSAVSNTDTPILDTVRQSFATSAANDQPANVLNNTAAADESFDANQPDVNQPDVNQPDVNTLPPSSAGNEQQTPAQQHTTRQQISQQEIVQQKTVQPPSQRSIDQHTIVQKATQANRSPASASAPLPGSVSLAGLGAEIDNLNLDAELRDQITLISPDRFQLLFPDTKAIKGNATYSATHPDGKSLPDYIKIDAQSGKISMQRALAPAGLSDVLLKVSRTIQDGEVKDVKSASVRVNLPKQSANDKGNA